MKRGRQAGRTTDRQTDRQTGRQAGMAKRSEMKKNSNQGDGFSSDLRYERRTGFPSDLWQCKTHPLNPHSCRKSPSGLKTCCPETTHKGLRARP